MKSEEYKQHILEYFKKNMAKGYDADTLKWSLIRQGYSRSIVDWGVEQVHKELAAKEPLLDAKEKPHIDYQRIEDDANVSKPKKSWWKRFFGVD